MNLTNILIAASLISLASPLGAAVTINVEDRTPDGKLGGVGNGSGTRILTTDLGSISAPPALDTTTYTVSNLDLSSVGGTASETIVFTVTYSQTGGTGVQFNGFGNVSVTGGADNNQVDPGETLQATIALGGGTTYMGSVSLGFTGAGIGGVGAGDTWDLVHDSGTITSNNSSPEFPGSSFMRIDTLTGNVNLQRMTIEINAVPEPATPILISLAGLALLRRRR